MKNNKEGLRAEQIRATLGMEPKEMPRILKEGISTKKLKTKGQKRATTYIAHKIRGPSAGSVHTPHVAGPPRARSGDLDLFSCTS